MGRNKITGLCFCGKPNYSKNMCKNHYNSHYRVEWIKRGNNIEIRRMKAQKYVKLPKVKTRRKLIYKQNKNEILRKARERNYKNKLIVINHYCNDNPHCQCPKCDIKEIHFLTIDHINNNGNKHRKEIGDTNLYAWIIRNNFPKDLRILCWNCNLGRDKNKGICHN